MLAKIIKNGRITLQLVCFLIFIYPYKHVLIKIKKKPLTRNNNIGIYTCISLCIAAKPGAIPYA